MSTSLVYCLQIFPLEFIPIYNHIHCSPICSKCILKTIFKSLSTFFVCIIVFYSVSMSCSFIPLWWSAISSFPLFVLYYLYICTDYICDQPVINTYIKQHILKHWIHYWIHFDQTSQEWSFCGPLKKLFK